MALFSGCATWRSNLEGVVHRSFTQLKYPRRKILRAHQFGFTNDRDVPGASSVTLAKLVLPVPERPPSSTTCHWSAYHECRESQLFGYNAAFSDKAFNTPDFSVPGASICSP